METIHYLFSYGTLQLEKVQLENYGRILVGNPEVLIGYTIKNLKITNKEVIRKSGKDVHPVVVKTNNPEDKVHGMIFEITQKELEETDAYEVNDYKRILETFESNKKAWIYVLNHDLKDSFS